jgi:hypothetical protein
VPYGSLVAAAALAALLASAWATPGRAQAPANQGLVVRDGSIGDSPAGVVQPGIDDLGQPADYLIRGDLGQQVGVNLFHSFERFSVDRSRIVAEAGDGTGGAISITADVPSCPQTA